MESSDSPVGSFLLTHNLKNIMTLQICTECKQEVSDKAQTCIHCGNPLSEQHTVQEVELTGKKYKKNAIFLVIMLDISAILLLNQQWGLGIFLFILAWVGGVINRIGAWWNNG